MNFKKLVAVGLMAAIAATTLTGCGGINPKQTIATLDGKDINAGVVNFWANYTAAMYDTYYGYSMGSEFWATEIEDGITFEDDAKEGILDVVKETYIVESHMADYGISITDSDKDLIAKTVDKFKKDNTSKALKAMGADDESLEEMLRVQAAFNKVRKEMIKDVDRTVSDEESVCNTFSYVILDKKADVDEAEGITEEESADNARQQCESIINMILANTGTYTDENGEHMEALEYAAKTCGLTVQKAAYTQTDLVPETNTTGLNIGMLGAVNELDEGICSHVENDQYYFIFRLDKIADEETTKAKTDQIIAEREEAAYNAIYDEWEKSADWSVDENVAANIKLSDKFFNIVSSNKASAANTISENVGNE